MNFIKIQYGKWKKMNSLFYTLGRSTLTIYKDGKVKFQDFRGRFFLFETSIIEQKGKTISFEIKHKESEIKGLIVLKGDKQMKLIWKDDKMCNYKLIA